MLHYHYSPKQAGIFLKKSAFPLWGVSDCVDEHTYHHIAVYASFIAPGCILQSGAFCFSKSFFEKIFFFGWHIHGFSVEGCRKGINTNPPPGRKGVRTWITLIGWNGKRDVSLMRTANALYEMN